MGDRELRGKALVASVSVAAAAAVSVGIAAWLRIYIPPWPTVTLVLALFITSVCLELAEAGASIARDERSRTGRDPWSGRSAPQHRDHQVEAAVESVMRWIDVPAAAVHIPELAAGKGTAMATAGAPAEWTSAPELAALADEAIASGLAALGHWPDAGDLHALAVPVAVDGGSPAAIVLAGDSLPFRGNDLKLAAGMLGQLLDERSPAPGGHWTVRDAAGHPGKLPLARQIEWLRAARLGRRREAALHAAWQSGSDGAVIACDSAGRPVRWNRRAERLVDVWELDLHDCHIVPLLAEMSGRDESEIRRAAADTLVSGEPFTFEIEDPVGRHNYVATLSPIPVDEGSIGGLVVRCVDITGVCRPARVEAQLMSVAAHEMRTPLTSVLGFSELIMNAAGDDSPIHERAETIHRQASRLESIVSELATVTRLQAGREELDVDLMDMSGVVRHIVESAQPMAAEHGVTVSATGVDTGYIIHGDTARLERVIENLVSNAIKYSPRGAEATVTVRRSRDRVIVDVTDTGYGIPTEDAPHVFEKFYRAKTDQTKGVQGTGLGLAIVKLIVEAHQGEVSLTTIEGEGSTFSISLPISGPPVPKITAQDIESAVKSRIPHETTH